MLIAIMLTALVGIAALAIDGARAYSLRRDLQAAVDAAALAGGDRLQQVGSYTSAEAAAATIFGTNLRLYGAPSCSPGYGTPGASPLTIICTFSDGTTLTEIVSNLGPQGSQFRLTATRTLQLQFARILATAGNPTLAGTATGSVNNLLYTPALGALGQDGCGGAAGAGITVNSAGATLNVSGDVVANGSISVPAGALKVAGDIYARCQPTVPGLVSTVCYPSGGSPPCTYPDVAGTTRSGFRLADPVFRAPAVSGGSRARPGDNVVLAPGSYAANPALATSRCYFLSGGVYAWSAGYSNTDAFVSNELKPPDEPNLNNNRTTSPHQFWNTNGVNCAGAFVLATKAGNAVPTGTWGIELTSVRTDSFGGVTFTRESAPSVCRTIAVAAGQVIQVQLSNVPGATSYNVYAGPPNTGCSGPMGLADNIAVTGLVQNNDTSGCPFGGQQGNGHGNGNGNNGQGCTLGGEDAILDATLLGALFAPNPLAPPGVVGAYPPDPERSPLSGNLPNQNPGRGNGVSGDRANENNCDTAAAGASTCPAAVTPGAVEFSVPSGGCYVNSNSGDTYVFSGYQYNWVSLFEPGAGTPPANTCTNTLGGTRNSGMIGFVYAAAATVNVTSADAYDIPASGGLLADTVSFTGSLPSIVYSSAYAPVPPASRLSG